MAKSGVSRFARYVIGVVMRHTALMDTLENVERRSFAR